MAHSPQSHHASLFSGRLKYADPTTLPSYPSLGLGLSKDDSATAAATAGWARQSIRHSKSCRTPRRATPASAPATSTATATAASRAADSEAQSRRHHQQGRGAREPASNTSVSASGTTPHPHGRSTPPAAVQDTFGSSAASLAFKSQPPPHPEPRPQATGMEATARNGASLTAAREAVRPRSVSSPVFRQRSPLLNDGAAAAGQRWSLISGPASGGAGSAAVTAMPRSMYTANPPVDLEVEEKKKADEIHSSAVAMARRIYLQQQQKDREAPFHDADDLQSSGGAPLPESPGDIHEAAYKLAQERLTKLQDEHRQNRDMREYYAPPPDSAPPRRRFSLVARLRRRSSHEGDEPLRRRGTVHVPGRIVPPADADAADEDQRRRDREALLAAARRNVRSQLDEMDQGVADKTGMVAPAQKHAWESRAHAIAHAKVGAAGGHRHEGERDVGGGAFVRQEAIDAVAAERVRPALEEMDRRAGAERERRRAREEEQAARRLEAEVEKAHTREIRDIYRKLKGEQKEKDAERRRVLREEDRKWTRLSQEGGADAPAVRATVAESTGRRGGRRSQEPPRTPSPAGDRAGAWATDTRESPLSPLSPLSPPGKVKNWLKTKLARQKPVSAEPDSADPGKGFVGGHMLRTPGGSSHSLLPPPSVREVAVAGRTKQALGEGPAAPAAPGSERGSPAREGPAAGERLSRAMSASPGTGDEAFEDARERLSPDLTPRRRMRVELPGQNRSPTRDSRFMEHIDD